MGNVVTYHSGSLQEIHMQDSEKLQKKQSSHFPVLQLISLAHSAEKSS